MKHARKINKYERQVDLEIDLHGLYVAEAQIQFGDFLEEALLSNCRRIKVITGKGLHSANGVGKIKEMVIDILTAHRLKFANAKPNDGGEGALIIDL